MCPSDEEKLIQPLLELLNLFKNNIFEAKTYTEGTPDYNILQRCKVLLKKDYGVDEIDNSNGVLCPHYPTVLLIPVEDFAATGKPIYPSQTSPVSKSSIINKIFGPNSPSSSSTKPTVNISTNGLVNSPTPTPQPSSQSNYQYQQTISKKCPSSTSSTKSVIVEELNHFYKIHDLMSKSKYARCRQRFVVPVILFRDKYICRSSTISVTAETYGRKVVDFAIDYISGGSNDNVDKENNGNNVNDNSLENKKYTEEADVKLLNALNINTIFDLMVEKRKVKYFVTVSSSEKADSEQRYNKFNLLSLPYPGCEFFEKFHDNNYIAEGLHYDWTPAFNDANISIPRTGPTKDLNINWDEYKSWDLVLLTQNYLKACLRHIQDDKSGILIHCISGWDRTPLFISLIRLSLWADKLIHPTLNAEQITYFTLAYDWYLFGHQLPNRLKKGEDIMFFCFHVLKYLTDDEFSAKRKRYPKISDGSEESVGSVTPNKAEANEDVFKVDPTCLDLHSNDSSTCNSSSSDNSKSYDPSDATIYSLFSSKINDTTSITYAAEQVSHTLKISKTNPISVPGASEKSQESASVTNSWQHVTAAGSIDSNVNTTVKVEKPKRHQRLNAVREIFINAYARTVGLDFVEGSGMSLSSLIGNVAEQFISN